MNRRGLLLGIGSLITAPAVVRAESLMKIMVLRDSVGHMTADEVKFRMALAYQGRILNVWRLQSSYLGAELVFCDGGAWRDLAHPDRTYDVLQLPDATLTLVTA